MAKRRSSSYRPAGRKRTGSKRPKDGSAFLWVVGAVFLAMFYIYWQNTGVVNKTEVLEKRIAPTLQKFQIKDKDLSTQRTEKRNRENKRYVHKEKVYNAPKDFSFNKFEAKLKKDLDRSEFKVVNAGRTVTRDAEEYHATINYDKYDVMDLSVVKPKVLVAPLPVEAKRYMGPKIAIVLDDFGYTKSNYELLTAIKEPITLSILPGLRYSDYIASQARAKGYEVILHLPLESERSDVPEETGTIRAGMSQGAVNSRLAKELSTIPGAVGVSNHQGSKSTSERNTMAPVFTYLKKNDLFFFDSMTSPKSVCKDLASDIGIPYARRDIFIDNSNDPDAIEAQLYALEKLALKKGQAIAIGHDRKNTIIVLRRMIPRLKEKGIMIVPLSELVK